MKPLADLFSLDGKTAIVTGAAAGIGRAISQRLAEAGANLVLVDQNAEGLDKIKKKLSRFGTQVETLSFDLADKAAIDGFWAGIDGADIDILVNNAGIYPFRPFLELDQAYLDKVLAVNLHSVLWMCQHMIKARENRGGSIINLGSIEAMLPFKDDLAQYSMGKAGVMALTRSLAREFGKKGFRVNALLPGGIISNGTRAAAASIVTKMKLSLIRDGLHYLRRVPLGRMGKPDEIAKMVLVLASDLSSYVQGALIPVDGGFLSC
jgi:NAD(P)-dependent dehydrogenase (short-subunit alcohol dehydrogenase family)